VGGAYIMHVIRNTILGIFFRRGKSQSPFSGLRDGMMNYVHSINWAEFLVCLNAY